MYFKTSPVPRYETKRGTKWRRNLEARYKLRSQPGVEEAAHDMTERVAIDRDYQAQHQPWWHHDAHFRKTMLLGSAKRFEIFDHLLPLKYKSTRKEELVRNSLGIEYQAGKSAVPIVSGNKITAGVTGTRPRVHWHTEKVDTVSHRISPAVGPRPPGQYSIAMVSLDGNLQFPDAEKLHWLVTNATEGSVDSGVEACTYAQLLPFNGTGWHRFVFLLLHQRKSIDLAAAALDKQRTNFSLETFIRTHDLSIDGFCFGQVTYDDSVANAYPQVHGVPLPEIQVRIEDVKPKAPPKRKRYHHQAKSNKELGRRR